MHENFDLNVLLELVEERKLKQLKQELGAMNEVDIASFAATVAACAEGGDTVAQSILLRAAAFLSAYTCRLLALSGASLVGVYGSVICQNATVRGEFERLVKARYPGVRICEPTVLPEAAAADYAKKLHEQGGHI